MSGSSYDRRRARREAERQRALSGETHAEFNARQTAKPPTLAEVFARNRADTAKCPVTPDLFERLNRIKAPRRRKVKQ